MLHLTDNVIDSINFCNFDFTFLLHNTTFQISCSVGSPDFKPSTVYSCAGGLNGRSLNFEYYLDASRAEPSYDLKSSRQILHY